MNHTTLETELTVKVAIDRVVATASYYTNGRNRFGVMSHGTCIFPEIGDQEARANGLLDSLESSHLDFVVKEMNDKNYLVGFGEHVFGIVFQEEASALEVNPPVVRKAEEVLSAASTSPKGHLLIGLLARTRLLADIATRQVVRVVQPK